MLSPAQKSALARAAASSVDCERTRKIPAELTLAQWALESGWGSHQPGNNCFGIKAYNGCFGIQLLKTVEFVNGVRATILQPFATFASLDACFNQHATLFSTARYKQAFEQHARSSDLDALIRQVSAVYATDPNYANLLFAIIAMPEVKQSLAACRLAVAA